MRLSSRRPRSRVTLASTPTMTLRAAMTSVALTARPPPGGSPPPLPRLGPYDLGRLQYSPPSIQALHPTRQRPQLARQVAPKPMLPAANALGGLPPLPCRLLQLEPRRGSGLLIDLRQPGLV